MQQKNNNAITLRDDALRRDYAVNSIYYNILTFKNRQRKMTKESKRET